MSELSVRETAARALHPRRFDPDVMPMITFGEMPEEARAGWIAAALDDADRVLAAVADHDGLADVLRGHRREAIARIREADQSLWLRCQKCSALHPLEQPWEDHLADVVRAWLLGAGELAQAPTRVPDDTSTPPCEGSA